MFFPTNPEWFHLGSYNAPLVRNMRELAPLVEWSNPLMGGLGTGGERVPCDMTGQTPPIGTSTAIQRLQETYVVDTYEGTTCDSAPLWINPPGVIQIQLQGAVNDDQRPHPKQSQGRFQEYLRPDDRCVDKENPDRWSRRREKTMMGGVRSGAQQSEGGTRRERSPHSSDEEDLRNVIDGLQHKRKSQTRDQSRTRGRYEPSS